VTVNIREHGALQGARVLFLSPRQCWPALSGAKLREYHFLRALGRRAELSYVYFASHGEKPLTTDDLPLCRRIVCVPKPPAYNPWKLVCGVLGRWPLSVLNYTSTEMTSALTQLLAVSDYDLFHVDGIHMYRYVDPLVRAAQSVPRVVYNWHNIESEAMRRYAATINSRARRLYARQTAAKIEVLERRILKTACGHIVCSERERTQLCRIASTARIAVVENGVDTAYFGGSDHGESTAKRIVFVGLMNYYPNVEGAVSFGNRIWPRLRERLPGMIFTIVGANPTPAVLALKAIAGIEVTGTVPDVRPYYRDALAAIVPLRTGGGTRLKALEAMAAGVPVISTELGAEGLAVTPEKNILIADAEDHEAWLRHLTRLAEFPGWRRQITTAATELVRARYDWEIIGEKLSQIYEEWLQKV